MNSVENETGDGPFGTSVDPPFVSIKSTVYTRKAKAIRQHRYRSDPICGSTLDVTYCTVASFHRVDSDALAVFPFNLLHANQTGRIRMSFPSLISQQSVLNPFCHLIDTACVNGYMPDHVQIGNVALATQTTRRRIPSDPHQAQCRYQFFILF